MLLYVICCILLVALFSWLVYENIQNERDYSERLAQLIKPGALAQLRNDSTVNNRTGDEQVVWLRSRISSCVRWRNFYAIMITLTLLGAVTGSAWVNLWMKEMDGKAELARAISTKQVSIETAKAKKESALHLANAEIIRARGVSRANDIIAQRLGGPEGYLRWLYIENLKIGQSKGATVVYVATEAGLPILESSRIKNLPTPPVLTDEDLEDDSGVELDPEDELEDSSKP